MEEDKIAPDLIIVCNGRGSRASQRLIIRWATNWILITLNSCS